MVLSSDWSDVVRRVRLIPVVTLHDAATAVPLGRALMAGGLPVMEVTFRTAAASATIERIAAELPGMVIGAGTVVTVDQARTARSCGASFIVSPGLSRAVVEWCLSEGVPVFPGVLTPTEITAALGLGLTVVKLFPAEAAGGVAYLKAVSAPFPDLRFIPTGGIDAKNLSSYLALPQVIACGGSWMVRPELVTGGRFEEVARQSAEAVRVVEDNHRGTETQRKR